MAPRSIRFLDESGRVIAKASMSEKGLHFAGTIERNDMPDEWQDLFEEFEEIVNGQMFSFLDDIQAKIASLPFRVVFDDGLEGTIDDLQIYPSNGAVSFKLAQVLVPSRKLAQ